MVVRTDVTATPKPSPSPSGGYWGTPGYAPGGTIASSPTATPSPSPAGGGTPSATLPGFPTPTGTSSTRGKKKPWSYVYYDPATGQLKHTAGPTLASPHLPNRDIPFTSLDARTKAYLQDIVDNTTRPSGRKWGTAADLWRYANTQNNQGAGSVWDILDGLATTSPQKHVGTGGTSQDKSWAKGTVSNDNPDLSSVTADNSTSTDQVAAPQPSTNTAIYKTVTSFTPADAETLLTSALTNAIGREPTAGEIRHFLGKLRSAARKNPSVSKVVSHNDGMGNTSQTTKQTPGFDSTSANVLADHVAEGGAFEKERRQNTANTMFNSFLSAIQSPTQVG